MRRDGRVLVLVDGRDVGGQWSRAVLGPALRHLGIPHRFWNVAHGLPSAAGLAAVSTILIGQDGLIGDLGAAGCEPILRAVHEGAGLVSLDGMLQHAPSNYRMAVGLSTRAPLRRASTTEFRVAAESHWIVQERPRAEAVRLRRGVRIMHGRLKPDVTVLATGDGYPILWARGLEDRGCYAAAADPRGDSFALAW